MAKTVVSIEIGETKTKAAVLAMGKKKQNIKILQSSHSQLIVLMKSLLLEKVLIELVINTLIHTKENMLKLKITLLKLLKLQLLIELIFLFTTKVMELDMMQI